MYQNQEWKTTKYKQGWSAHFYSRVIDFENTSCFLQCWIWVGTFAKLSLNHEFFIKWQTWKKLKNSIRYSNVHVRRTLIKKLLNIAQNALQQEWGNFPFANWNGICWGLPLQFVQLMKIHFLPHLESFMWEWKFEKKFFKKSHIQT